jgi:hypothetical protein
MTPVEIQLIISVTTILFSGVVAAVVAHKLSSDRAEREFKRKKLEELYIAVHHYCTKLFTANIIWPEVMRGKINYDEALDLSIKNHSENDKSHETTMMMIINIYFPELLPPIEAILRQRDQINRVKSDFKQAYQRHEVCDSFAQPFLQELKAIDEVENKLTGELFRISRSLK